MKIGKNTKNKSGNMFEVKTVKIITICSPGSRSGFVNKEMSHLEVYREIFKRVLLQVKHPMEISLMGKILKSHQKSLHKN